MNVNVPDSLREFLNEQVNSGGYTDADAFVADLLRAEAAMFDRIKRGEPLPVDEHFDRRMETLLDEGASSGDYVSSTKHDFDAMEEEALRTIRGKQKS